MVWWASLSALIAVGGSVATAWLGHWYALKRIEEDRKTQREVWEQEGHRAEQEARRAAQGQKRLTYGEALRVFSLPRTVSAHDFYGTSDPEKRRDFLLEREGALHAAASRLLIDISDDMEYLLERLLESAVNMYRIHAGFIDGEVTDAMVTQYNQDFRDLVSQLRWDADETGPTPSEQ